MNTTFLVLSAVFVIVGCSAQEVRRIVIRSKLRPTKDKDALKNSPETFVSRRPHRQESYEETTSSAPPPKIRRGRPRIRTTTQHQLSIADFIELTTTKPSRSPLLIMFDKAPTFKKHKHADADLSESRQEINITGPKAKNKQTERPKASYEVYEVIVDDIKPPQVPRINVKQVVRKPQVVIKPEANDLGEDLSVYSSEEDEQVFGRKIKGRRNIKTNL